MRVLAVDDDTDILRFVEAALGAEGHEVVAVPSAEDALARLDKDVPDVLLTDLRLAGMDGLQLLEEARRGRPDLPVIVMTAHGSVKIAVEAMRRGAADFVQKPLTEEDLARAMAALCRLRRLQSENRFLRRELQDAFAPGREVTGQSVAIRKVLREAERVAPTDSSVLIRGETGTGKELVAQAIHRLSARRSHLMVRVNCAALPSGLVESELFGREKGAFTGAMTRQVGRFEVADGSTLFLDEVGELSLEVQAKLLRVLETGEFERLGSPRTIKVDVRLIAATNRDLLEEVRRGRFREDLYYRLNVFPIRVPPLRERAEDIPLLVWAFVEEFSSRMGKKITQVPPGTIEALKRHPWPGNVRELRNVIERAAILTTGGTLAMPALGDAVLAAAAPAAAVEAEEQTLEQAERTLILRTLESRRWQVKGAHGAAAVLGVNPSTLYSRMKKLGIRAPEPTENGSA
jgi:formate hydrogenlyase transcriptional activator